MSLEKFSIAFTLILGILALVIDFHRVRYEQHVGVIIFDEQQLQAFAHVKSEMDENCAKVTYYIGPVIRLDGGRCALGQKFVQDTKNKYEVEIKSQEMPVSGSGGNLLFLFTGIWMSLVGVYLSFKILKSEE